MSIDEVLKIILVSIQIPGLEVEPTNPAWLINGYAGGILNDLLTVELSANNLLAQPSTNGPRPFACTLLFAVGDVETAATIVWSVLKRNQIDNWATVFCFEAGEMIWRSIYPRRGIGLLTDHLVAESAALALKSEKALTLWQEALKAARP